MKKFITTMAFVCVFLFSGNDFGSAAQILFQDDFNDGTNDGWTTTIGTWTASSGHNEATGTESTGHIGQHAYAYTGNPLWSDYTLDVDITFGTNVSEFYVCVRADPTTDPFLYSSKGNQYLISIGAHYDGIRLRYQTLVGFYDIIRIDNYPILERGTYHVQLSILGNNIKGAIDGNPLFDYTFSGTDPIFDSGVVGIGYKSNEGPDGAYFDNVVISAPIAEDSDSDGVPDDEDGCPNSDLSETVIIDDCDSGVDNVLLDDGCTISDLISQCADDAKNQGKFLSCVSHTTNYLMNGGIICSKDKKIILCCGANADIP